MSSTGVVAIFIPIVLRIAQNTGTAPSRLMMPLSVAALISGMMTLVATAPNLVVDAELRAQRCRGFEFFSFTPFGLPVLALGVLYMLFARRWLSAEVDRARQPVGPAAPARLDRGVRARRARAAGADQGRLAAGRADARGAAAARQVGRASARDRARGPVRARDRPPGRPPRGCAPATCC